MFRLATHTKNDLLVLLWFLASWNVTSRCIRFWFSSCCSFSFCILASRCWRNISFCGTTSCLTSPLTSAGFVIGITGVGAGAGVGGWICFICSNCCWLSFSLRCSSSILRSRSLLVGCCWANKWMLAPSMHIAGDPICCTSMWSVSDSGDSEAYGEFSDSRSQASPHVDSAIVTESFSNGKNGRRRSISCGFGPDTGKLRFFSSTFKSDTFSFSSLAKSKVLESGWHCAGLGIDADNDDAFDTGSLCVCCA